MKMKMYVVFVTVVLASACSEAPTRLRPDGSFDEGTAGSSDAAAGAPFVFEDPPFSVAGGFGGGPGTVLPDAGSPQGTSEDAAVVAPAPQPPRDGGATTSADSGRTGRPVDAAPASRVDAAVPGTRDAAVVKSPDAGGQQSPDSQVPPPPPSGGSTGTMTATVDGEAISFRPVDAWYVTTGAVSANLTGGTAPQPSLAITIGSDAAGTYPCGAMASVVYTAGAGSWSTASGGTCTITINHNHIGRPLTGTFSASLVAASGGAVGMKTLSNGTFDIVRSK